MKKKSVFVFSVIIICFFIFPITNFTISPNTSSYEDIIDKKEKTYINYNSIINNEQVQERLNNKERAVANFFIENKGQFGNEFYYQTHYLGMQVGFASSQIIFRLRDEEIKVNFIGSNDINPQGMKFLHSYSNYYFNEGYYPNIRHCSEIHYENLYEGISLVYRFSEKGLKYDFIVEPYAEINQIKIEYDGIEKIVVTPTRLELNRENIRLIDDCLLAWYEGTKKPIEISYEQKIGAKNIIQFSIEGQLDTTQRMIIDPLICTYSTFIGGSALEHPSGGADVGEKDIMIDEEGYIYYVGRTSSTNFPIVNAFQSSFNGIYDAILFKMSPDGQSLIFATLLGGTSHDWANGVAIDSSGNIAIVGTTESTNFPILNAYQSTHNSGDEEDPTDMFVAKFNSSGGLLFSTFFGGSNSDWAYGVKFDVSGNIIFCGGSSSQDFYTKNAFQSNHSPGDNGDITLTKLAADGQSVIFSSFYGGASSESARDMVLDSHGNIILTGSISGTEFPTYNAYQTSLNGGFASHIVKFNPSGSLIFATTIDGANFDTSSAITVDSDDNIVITGGTLSANYPLKNATQTILGGNQDIIITKISEDGQELLLSTLFGGNGGDEGQDVKIDSNGNIIVVGMTSSDDFLTQHAYQDSYSDNWDACIVIIAANGTLLSSSYLGGSGQDQAIGLDIDSENTLIIGGWTLSANFPTKNAYQSTLKGTNDIFITKLYLDLTFTPTATGKIDLTISTV
ncbi:MAG: SBBP repeat-containing protein, partial [Candidatus Thorarchaeota archaeon]